jgi:AcrR family transcriptional regulator
VCDGDEVTVNPHRDDRLQAGDELILIGLDDRLEQLGEERIDGGTCRERTVDNSIPRTRTFNRPVLRSDRPTGRSVANPRHAKGAKGSTMPNTRPDPAEQSRSRRERILDAAFHAFATRGYRDTAVDDIANASETSKGGIYFHFPTKEAIFRELMQTTADRLVAKVEREVAKESEPVAKADAALRSVLAAFAGHRTTARLLFLDTIGAGRVFQAETNALHERFARLIQGYLDEAVVAGAIPEIDTRITSIAWFGALNEVVARWLQAEHPVRLDEAYPALRAALLRSAGVPAERIGPVPAPAAGWDFPEVSQ